MSPNSTTNRPRGENLFDLTTQALELKSFLEELEGEVPEGEEGDAILAYLNDTSQALDEKLDAYVALLAEFHAREEICRREAARYQQRAQSAATNRELLKERLKLYFLRIGKTEHATARHTIKLVNSGGVIPVRIDPTQKPEQVPERFRKVIYDFDKDAIRKALADGETLNFAVLGDRGQSIRIR